VKIKLTLSALFLASAMASAQQVDPVQVIKNQIDSMNAWKREFDKSYLGIIEKDYLTIQESEKYLDSIGFPYADDPQEHSRFEEAVVFELARDHNAREERLTYLKTALEEAQANLPFLSPNLSRLVETLGGEIQKDDIQAQEDQSRLTEIDHLSDIVVMCFDPRYKLDEFNQNKVGRLANQFLQQPQQRAPHSSLTPEEQMLANDLHAIVEQQRPAIREAERQANIKAQADREKAEAAKAAAAEAAKKDAQAKWPKGPRPHSPGDDYGDRTPQNPGQPSQPPSNGRPNPAAHPTPGPKKPDPLGPQQKITPT
jgi:hypothetical protein